MAENKCLLCGSARLEQVAQICDPCLEIKERTDPRVERVAGKYIHLIETNIHNFGPESDWRDYREDAVLLLLAADSVAPSGVKTSGTQEGAMFTEDRFYVEQDARSGVYVSAYGFRQDDHGALRFYSGDEPVAIIQDWIAVMNMSYCDPVRYRGYTLPENIVGHR